MQPMPSGEASGGCGAGSCEVIAGITTEQVLGAVEDAIHHIRSGM